MQTTPQAFGSTYAAEAALPDEHFAGRLATSAVFGAYADDQIVGVIGCKRHEGVQECHKAFIWGLYVDPAFRRSGVARALLDACLQAVDPGVEQLLLTVVADNRPAIALYEHFDFRPYGVEPRALKSNGIYADEVLMVLLLSGPTER